MVGQLRVHLGAPLVAMAADSLDHVERDALAAKLCGSRVLRSAVEADTYPHDVARPIPLTPESCLAPRAAGSRVREQHLSPKASLLGYPLFDPVEKLLGQGECLGRTSPFSSMILVVAPPGAIL